MAEKMNRAARRQGLDTPVVAAGKIDKRTLLTGVVVGAVVVAVILIVFGVFYYQTYIGPFRATVITVDGNQIKMDYFLKRARLAGSDPMFMLQSLSNELIVKSAAPGYGIHVTNFEVDEYLRAVASGGSGNITDVEFKEWYRQQLNDNRLSEAQYREIATSSVLMVRMQSYLAAKTPSVGEQVHVNAIAVRTFEEAEKVKARLGAGEKFADVASKVSIDGSSKDRGGDIGWISRGTSIFDGVVFDLEIGQFGEPYPYYENRDPAAMGQNPPDAWFVLMVSEKDPARQLDEDALSALRGRALELWLQEEVKNHSVRFNFNSENYAWMKWQLAKNQPAK